MSRDNTAMRLLCNMATGKGLAIVFRPKTINLISNNKLNKLPCGIVQRCSTCHRSVTTVALSVGSWNSKKSGKCNVSVWSQISRRLHHTLFIIRILFWICWHIRYILVFWKNFLFLIIYNIMNALSSYLQF